LNAIIGFAEIIDGQYLGPAHRNYRERASEIVSQARILLAAIEDLDFAARMRGAAGKGDSTSADAVLAALAEEMTARAGSRQVDIRMIGRGGRLAFALERDLADRLLRRFIGAIIDAADQGEQIRVALGEERGNALLSLTRPAATSHLSSRQLLDPAFHTASEGEESRLGLGFGLRLVRGLVRLAGGELRLGASDFILAIPAAKQ
jgi:signal transduction histidine kinase